MVGRTMRILQNFYITGDVKALKKSGLSSTTAHVVNGVAVVINWAFLPFSLMLAMRNMSVCNARSKNNKILRKLIISLSNVENAGFVVELLQKNEGDLVYTLCSDEEMAQKFLTISGSEEKLSQIKRLKHVFVKITKKNPEVPAVSEIPAVTETEA
jgi:hypothetical protein